MFYSTKPIGKMRNHDVGDWDDNGNITVAKVGNRQMEFLTAVHECIEWQLCAIDGISDAEVSEWDKNHKKMGDDPKALYHKHHVFAENIERLLAEYIGIEWSEYDKIISNL